MERKSLYVVTQWANRKRTKSQWKIQGKRLRVNLGDRLNLGKNESKNKKTKTKTKSEILGKPAYRGGAESVTARALDLQRWVHGQNLKHFYIKGFYIEKYLEKSL